MRLQMHLWSKLKQAQHMAVITTHLLDIILDFWGLDML